MTNGFPSVLLWQPLRYWNTHSGQRINGGNKGRKRNDGAAQFHVVRAPGPRSPPPPRPSSPPFLFRGRGPSAKSHVHVAEICRRWMKRRNCWLGARGSEGGSSAWMFHCRLWKTQTLINYRRYLSPKSYPLLLRICSFDKLTRCVLTCSWEMFRRFLRYD